MILGLSIYCGCTVDVVEFIVGSVMQELAGVYILPMNLILVLDQGVPVVLERFSLSLNIACICCRLTNEQRTSITDYFRLYKVCTTLFPSSRFQTAD
jgi:hypothetical protein